ncbi:hypothetical protein LENED_012150 [Lentinula edodes]|uniref:Uncharacterized protein n=1 Tax=Lentinula edodes TaxID=5353 RepID=A0A1Q3ERX1_LENED|nr:hypothetical protein LENED_012150 [Lentinula edodes]
MGLRFDQHALNFRVLSSFPTFHAHELPAQPIPCSSASDSALRSSTVVPCSRHKGIDERIVARDDWTCRKDCDWGDIARFSYSMMFVPNCQMTFVFSEVKLATLDQLDESYQQHPRGSSPLLFVHWNPLALPHNLLNPSTTLNERNILSKFTYSHEHLLKSSHLQYDPLLRAEDRVTLIEFNLFHLFNIDGYHPKYSKPRSTITTVFNLMRTRSLRRLPSPYHASDLSSVPSSLRPQINTQASHLFEQCQSNLHRIWQWRR